MNSNIHEEMIKNPTGKLDLSFRKKKSGETYIAKQYYDLPLQVLPPYYQDDDGTAFTYLLNLTGGVLQGDRLLTNIKVEKDAKAVITTTSANRFYKMENDHAKLVNDFEVEENGVLEYIPDYNIPYAKAEIYQENIFRIKQNSTLITWDMVIPGRIDRGEKFDYNCYSSKTKIFVEDKLEVFEYCKLTPKDKKMLSIGILENYNIYASIFVYQKDLPESLKENVEKSWEEFEEVQGGISFVNKSMAAIKIFGNSVFEMEEVLLNLWDATRKTLLNKSKVKIRKY